MTDDELNLWVARHLTGFPELTATRLPYCSDLNVCASAEAKIRELGLQDEYVPHLASICFPGEGEDNWFLYCFGLSTATARQRCEAMFAIRDQIEKARDA